MGRVRCVVGFALVLLCPALRGTAAPVDAVASTSPAIDAVFFAQHHVLAPDNPLFKLVGGLDALIKVQVYSDRPVPSPSVVAVLELDANKLEVPLVGPAELPRRPDVDPVLMAHTYRDSFAGVIPGEWVRQGLAVSVELREYNYLALDDDDTRFTDCVPGSYITTLDRRDFDDLKIGAPTRLVMQMFDIHYFGRGRGSDFPAGWEREMEAKLPVAELVIHRARDIVFNEIVMPPQVGKPSAMYRGLDDYKSRTGKTYDGEQGIALRWGSALKAAAGRNRWWRPYQINICGVPSGGQAGGYRSCANMHRHGVVLHELGHTFGLPHWNRNKAYPYKRTMYGRDRGEPSSANAGPTWAFDLGRRDFISPRREQDGRLVWKNDPMQGGGKSRTKDYMYTHFSDYSIDRIRARLESAVYWNEAIDAYARWNQETGDYDKVVPNDGIQLPSERDVDVITLLCSANVAVPDANIVYPPIGPYTACLIRRFDATSAQDREDAQAHGYTPERCNVALRVTQGGAERTYLMSAHVSPDDDPMKTFNATAINLPARDGDVSEVELLYCPGLVVRGVTEDSEVLYTWRRSEQVAGR